MASQWSHKDRQTDRSINIWLNIPNCFCSGSCHNRRLQDHVLPWWQRHISANYFLPDTQLGFLITHITVNNGAVSVTSCINTKTFKLIVTVRWPESAQSGNTSRVFLLCEVLDLCAVLCLMTPHYACLCVCETDFRGFTKESGWECCFSLSWQ